MYKNYKHKLNMLEPGSKMLELMGILFVIGLLTHYMRLYMIRNIVFASMGIFLVDYLF